MSGYIINLNNNKTNKISEDGNTSSDMREIVFKFKDDNNSSINELLNNDVKKIDLLKKLSNEQVSAYSLVLTYKK